MPLELRLVRRPALLELHQHRLVSITVDAGDVDQERRQARPLRRSTRPRLERRRRIRRSEPRASGDRATNTQYRPSGPAPTFCELAVEERRELRPRVVEDDDSVLRELLVELAHRGTRAADSRVRLRVHLLTAVEVRSRMRSSTSYGRFARAAAICRLRLRPRRRPRARVRSRGCGPSAHLGTTRSGQRCIASCAQSYLPAASSSHFFFSSRCQALVRHQPPERRHHQHDPIVERRLPERRYPLHLLEQHAQLLDKRLLRLDLRDAPSPTGFHPSSAPGWSAGAPRRRASEPSTSFCS